MKKILFTMLGVLILFAAASCNDTKKKSDKEGKTPSKEIVKEVKSQAKELNAECPTYMGSLLLQSVDFDEDSYTLTYRFVGPFDSKPSSSKLKEIKRNMVDSLMGKSDTRSWLKEGIKIKYVYLDESGNKAFEVKIDSSDIKDNDED